MLQPIKLICIYALCNTITFIYTYIHTYLKFQEDRFAKCDICVKVKNEKKGTMDKEVQKQLQEKLNKHLDRVKLAKLN